MSKRKPLRVGGVPEHFNLPWHLSMEQGLFAAAGVDLTWKDYAGGTGAMTRELRHRQLDIAVLLTEGMVASAIQGTKAKIVQFYVSTPLTWGAFVNANSPIQRISDVDRKRFAISRIGSGSHLMANVFATEYDYKLHETDPYKVVGDLDGAADTMRQDPSLLFLWEEFTAKHLVEQGEFRMIDKFVTPWPCFVIAVRNETLNRRGDDVQKVLDIINAQCQQFMQNSAESIEMVAARYGISAEDTATWFNRTQWQCNTKVEPVALDKVVDYLHKLKMVKKTVTAEFLTSKFTELNEENLAR
jgi:sulfonate transport system substrate-binding protein